jgi:putative aldouronate transport system permease protein
MVNNSVAATGFVETKEMRIKRRTSLRKQIFKSWQLYLMLILPVGYLLLFSYYPMYGIQIAFREYRPKHGITGSEWVGLKHFIDFFSDPMFRDVFGNTIKVSLYSFVTFPLPIILALVLNCMNSKKYRGMIQNVVYVPHFISVTVLVGIIQMILSPVSGLYGTFYRLFGGDGFPTDIRALAESFRHIYVWSGVWQNLGWNSIIYMAALSSVSSELHEAAQLDGASRIQRIWHIDIPAIAPTIAILLIQRCASIASVGFEKAYLLQSTLNIKVSEVIATYTYKEGMSSFTQYSYGAAIGIFNMVINLAMLFIANSISKKITEGEVSYF